MSRQRVPLAGIHLPKVVLAFRDKVGPVITPEGCRGWLGKMSWDKDGRPNPHFAGGPLYKYRTKWLRKPVLATRFSYAYATGVDPGELDILHSCDHSWCVEPSHMRLGTPKENARDVQERFINSKGGEGSSQSKLTHQQRREIYERAISGVETLEAIAKDYNVSRSLVGLIRKGKTGAYATGA